MKREIIPGITNVLLVIAMIICGVTGLVKWPGLISTLGMSYRQVPLVLVTDIHIWSGLCMVVFAFAHIFQSRCTMKRKIRSLVNKE